MGLGRHLLADLHGVAPHRLSDPAWIESRLREAAAEAGATPLAGHFHHFGEGLGVTGVLLLCESHMTIHTWPEHGFAAIDVFMCGEAEPERAVEALRLHLQPARLDLSSSVRGHLLPAGPDV
ncbi:adenosylmethionine decarboxylase [Chitinivorax sp. PXF-14]|uniref:adenosylmethionine decarboxylase n=1 Tax=Chitinivorax sp. PXF-14 TaxID=3230488 RepID=UPI0034651C6E